MFCFLFGKSLYISIISTSLSEAFIVKENSVLVFPSQTSRCVEATPPINFVTQTSTFVTFVCRLQHHGSRLPAVHRRFLFTLTFRMKAQMCLKTVTSSVRAEYGSDTVDGLTLNFLDATVSSALFRTCFYLDAVKEYYKSVLLF